MGNSAETNLYTYKYTDFTKDIRKIAQWLKGKRDGYTKYEEDPWEPDMIVSINRGGLVAGVYLSHLLDIPHFPIHYQTRDHGDFGHDKTTWTLPYRPPGVSHTKNILLLDDINDSGKTFTDIMTHWKSSDLGEGPMDARVKTVSLIQRKTSKFAVDFSPIVLDNNKWVVFPWENK
jgi:hypoxanthine phosphoribosyltransferase